jgi:folate-dependent tRNA-U54 methylase TrmFO/GidA
VQTVDEKQYHSICPECDAYGLGIEMEESFPVITQAGWVTNVHMLNLWSESSTNKERDALLVELKDCILRHKSAAEDDDVAWWNAENQALSSLFAYLRKHSVLNVNADLLMAIDEDGFSDHATEVAELLEQQADALPEADRVLVTGLFKSLWSS